MDELRAICAEADAWQTYVMAHAYTPKAIRRAVEAGVRTIEHGNLVDEETAQLLKHSGVFVVPTLITYDMLFSEGPSLGLPPESIAKIDEVRLVGREAIELLNRVGVRMGYGSDLLGETGRDDDDPFPVADDDVAGPRGRFGSCRRCGRRSGSPRDDRRRRPASARGPGRRKRSARACGQQAGGAPVRERPRQAHLGSGRGR